jgi:hypothetical protein
MEDCYLEGLLASGPLDAGTNATLIRYHKEWLR